MKKTNSNLEDTQELKLPNSDKKYGDDFEYDCSTEKNFKLKNLDKLQVILVSLIAIIVIIILCIIFFKITSSTNTTTKFKNVTSATNSLETQPQSNSLVTEPSITTEKLLENITEVETEMETETETEKTNVPTEGTTTPLITEPCTDEPSNNPIDSTSITEPNSVDIQKNISVSDISVTRLNITTFTAIISGEFIGYSEEELLAIITVNTTTGTPQVERPYFSDSNSFTLNLNLEDCEGELHIHIDNYDFYQSISSFPD